MRGGASATCVAMALPDKLQNKMAPCNTTLSKMRREEFLRINHKTSNHSCLTSVSLTCRISQLLHYNVVKQLLGECELHTFHNKNIAYTSINNKIVKIKEQFRNILDSKSNKFNNIETQRKLRYSYKNECSRIS